MSRVVPHRKEGVVSMMKYPNREPEFIDDRPRAPDKPKSEDEVRWETEGGNIPQPEKDNRTH